MKIDRLTSKAKVVRIEVTEISDKSIVRCPKEGWCKDGLSCPHGKAHVRRKACSKPKYTGCPGCVLVRNKKVNHAQKRQMY